MKTVYVGLSGGVDSSVSAALLKEQGFAVVGVYMKNWTQDVAGVACPWKQDLADARAAAAVLDIPFKVFDFQAEYKQHVVDVMVAEYQAGRTPNPDVMCNQEIKFKLFLQAALADGADYIATGHYAQVWHKSDEHRVVANSSAPSPYHPYGSARASSAPSAASPYFHQPEDALLTAADANKDQTYFLYRVTKAALEKTLFPVGGLTKPKVRELAAKFGLPTAAKPDSQGICFVGEVGIKEFLSQYVIAQPGPVVNQRSGETVGRHDGAIFYTIGQRHGLGIGGGKPFYVTGKDMAKNAVFVTDDPADLELASDTFTLENLHWIDEAPKAGKTYQVRARYRAELIDGVLEPAGKNWHVKLAKPERAISPGQSAVIYDGNHVLGGGIIAAGSN